MNFEDFIFPDRLENQVKFLVRNPEKVPKLLCFYGPPGIEKTIFSRFIADELCEFTVYHDMSEQALSGKFFADLENVCAAGSVFSSESGFHFDKAIILDKFHDLTERNQNKFTVDVERFERCLFIICLTAEPGLGIGKVLTPELRSRAHLIDLNLRLSESEEVTRKVEDNFPELLREEAMAYYPDEKFIDREALMVDG